jgi:hypothetical protein
MALVVCLPTGAYFAEAALHVAVMGWTKRRTMMTRNRHVCVLTRAADSSAELRYA